MKILVKAKTKAKIEKVEKLAEIDTYKVSVKEAPVDGKANEAIIKALARYFDVAPSTISLVTGQTSKIKVFMIK
jgi:uncharacterized protein YggU (UPF0235/DUF167 family)